MASWGLSPPVAEAVQMPSGHLARMAPQAGVVPRPEFRVLVTLGLQLTETELKPV